MTTLANKKIVLILLLC